jgi:hypothetical protein
MRKTSLQTQRNAALFVVLEKAPASGLSHLLGQLFSSDERTACLKPRHANRFCLTTSRPRELANVAGFDWSETQRTPLFPRSAESAVGLLQR